MRWPRLTGEEWRAIIVQIIASAAILAIASTYAVGAESGVASYYGGRHHGSRMANGQRFDQHSNSCAHRRHPFGTRLTVTMGGRSVQCVVRDRGPWVRGRVIDLSVAGARHLGLIGRGIGRVRVSAAQ